MTTGGSPSLSWRVTSAPCSNNAFVMPTWPSSAARWRAVALLYSMPALTSALVCSMSCTEAMFPAIVAAWSGRAPLASATSNACDVARSMSSIISGWSTAKCNAVLPCVPRMAGLACSSRSTWTMWTLPVSAAASRAVRPLELTAFASHSRRCMMTCMRASSRLAAALTRMLAATRPEKSRKILRTSAEGGAVSRAIFSALSP
mmetsp:Transcript_63035/g.149345  ORF Transcript_63035/g.149345 Transcript_63035/m.149345 type:complete len:203 (+) Transcript_63035:227-835(+)